VEALMRRHFDHGRRWAIVAALLLTIAVGPASASSDIASASALKAAFLYNFVKFIEWPGDSIQSATPLAMCVVGDHALADALDDMVRGRTVGGHDLAVRRPRLEDDAVRSCQVLYVTGLDERRMIELVDRLAGVPMLTASDAEGFAQLGGVAHFFVEGGKMRFAVNLQSAQRARLTVSSKLLGLAVVVKDRRGSH
jgi:uncharacterized protein DUF4154